MASNIWKSLLVLTVVIFLNLIYVTQNFLVSPDDSPHHELYLFSVKSVQHVTANEGRDTVTPIKGGKIEDDKTRKENTVELQRESEQKYDGNGVGNTGGEKYRDHLGSEKSRMEATHEQKSKEEVIENDSGPGGDEKKQGNNLDGDKMRIKDTGELQSETENDGISAVGAGEKEHKVDIANTIEFIPRRKASERLKWKRQQRQKNKTKENEKKNDHTYTLSPKDLIKYSAAPMPKVSNAIYYKDIDPEYLVENPSAFLWDRPDAMIPEWMKDYFRWHRWKRSTWEDKSFTADGDWWKSERWMISQCLMDQDRKKCGGTADRLVPILPLLRMAYENKRVYLIRWTRPAPLEEFLLPPVGGFDWRVPPFLAAVMDNEKNGQKFKTRKPILNYGNGGLALLRARWQTHEPNNIYDNMLFNATLPETETETINSTHYNKENNKELYGFDALFPRAWKVMFTPSPPIQDILRSRLADLDLVPNEYVSSHLRALYATDTRPTELIQRFAENALACANEIFPGVPIFFASDSTVALEYARGFNGKKINLTNGVDNSDSLQLRVVTATTKTTPLTSPNSTEGRKNASAAAITEPWHLDSFVGPIENFYDTFVDLYLLAMAGCVTYSKGGFGRWGTLIGGRTYCARRQFFIGARSKNLTAEFCNFRSTDIDNIHKAIPSINRIQPEVFGKDDLETGPVFLPPMDKKIEGILKP